MIFGTKSERFIPTDTGQTSLFDSIEEPSAESRDSETEISLMQEKTTQKSIKKKPVR
tara:strand:- start:1496 stop:1666 length:171 start_codon:yes stop_codon:yes gene_type:complete